MLNTKWTPKDIARMIEEENDDDEGEQFQPDFVKKLTNPENRRKNNDIEDDSDKDEEKAAQIKNSGKRSFMESADLKNNQGIIDFTV